MPRTREILTLSGRPLRVHDTADHDASEDTVVLWHHGTPQTGALPVPLAAALRERRLRGVSYDRPGYGGSARQVGRDVAAAAADVAVIADALGIEAFFTMGASGGGPHALACALLPRRVTAVVSVAGLAPFDADGLDWFAGMAPTGGAELRAAAGGRETLEAHLRATDFDPDVFTAADHAALAGDWRSLGEIAAGALPEGFDGMVDDDLAYVRPWGFSLSAITVPVLLIHGEDDRVVPSAHGGWLARHVPSAERWSRPGDGHVSVLDACPAALDWLLDTRPRSV